MKTLSLSAANKRLNKRKIVGVAPAELQLRLTNYSCLIKIIYTPKHAHKKGLLWYRGSPLPQKHFKLKQVKCKSFHWLLSFSILHGLQPALFASVGPCVGNHSYKTGSKGLYSSIFAGTFDPRAHTQSHSAFSFIHFFFFFFFGGEGGCRVALLQACSCILGFLAGFQGANKTPLYPWGVGTAFRLSCRCWDQTQSSYTGGRGGNEQPPVINHILSDRLFWSGEHSNHQKPTWKVEI